MRCCSWYKNYPTHGSCVQPFAVNWELASPHKRRQVRTLLGCEQCVLLHYTVSSGRVIASWLINCHWQRSYTGYQEYLCSRRLPTLILRVARHLVNYVVFPCRIHRGPRRIEWKLSLRCIHKSLQCHYYRPWWMKAPTGVRWRLPILDQYAVFIIIK